MVKQAEQSAAQHPDRLFPVGLDDFGRHDCKLSHCLQHSALAGFVEAGETLEQCVERETAEEVNVRIADLRYRGSQSWPFPHSLMLAFTARWTGGEIVPQAGEIEHAQWFALDALPQIPPRFSISGHLIRDAVALLQAGRTP